MGLFDLFKSKPENEKSSDQNEPKVSFEVLRDDGVRAMKMGEVPYAVKCFTAALEMKEDLTTLSFLAEAQFRLQNYEEARPLLEKLVAEAPDNLTVQLLLARTLGELKDYAAMKEVSQKAMALDAESAGAKYHMANASFHLGDPFTAIALLTQALQAHADFTDARSLRARILAGMCQFQEAIEDTQLLVEAQPENEEYLLQHTAMLAALDRNEEAIDCVKKIMEYNPFNQDAVLEAARLYAKTSQFDKALTVLDEAIDLQPEFARAYKERGGIKLHLKDKDGAAADLKKSLEIEPELGNQIGGEFSTLENQINDRYKSMNPYGF